MLTIDIDTSELGPYRERIKREAMRQIARAVTDAAREGVAEAKRVGRFKDRRHVLRSTIHATDARATANGAEAEMIAPAAYALFVEAGTRPHPIYPKAARGFIGPLQPGQSRRKRGTGKPRRFLRFEIGGRVVFARMVNHPGSRPYPFMGPGTEKAERVLFARLEVLPERLARL